MTSSDSRSFPIRPRIRIPKFDETNIIHQRIAELSKMAHKKYRETLYVKQVCVEIDTLYLSILDDETLVADSYTPMDRAAEEIEKTNNDH